MKTNQVTLESLGYKLEKRNGNYYYNGCLDLEGTGITSLPDNLTVGGCLYLEGTGITSLPDNLTVGGCLYLRGTGITSLPDNLTVVGYLDLEGTGITNTSMVHTNIKKILSWRNMKYISVDGIFSEVIYSRGNIYKIKQIGDKKERYLITDGCGRWSHGDTIKDAKNDLLYKISNRDKTMYNYLTLDSELTFQEAIEAYRVITGACSAGTKMFVENELKNKKEKYTIEEIIKITEGQYNSSEFKNFFNK